MASALVIGATGLIGKQLVQLLTKDLYYSKVIAVTRKPFDFGEKVENLVIDFSNLKDRSDLLRSDHVFCCLGTTMRQAKTKEAFRKVDFDYPLEVARITKANGASHFMLVTALGANANSSVFYNQVKGEIEKAIGDLQFSSLHIFRPSLLMGPRSEARSGEGAAKVVFKYLDVLIPKKYKAIDSMKVAKAMQHFARQSLQGVFIHESASMQSF